MVGIVNGSELGLAAGVVGQSIGQVQYGQQPTGVYVNAATGNLVVQNNDLNLKTLGTAISITQTYNSDGNLIGQQGWLIGVGKTIKLTGGTLNQPGSTLINTLPDGSLIVYQYNAAQGDYVSEDGSVESGIICSTATGWTYFDQSSQVTESYDQSGRLVKSADSICNATQYNYQGTSNQLSSIVDASGETIQFGFNAQGQLTGLSEISGGITTQLISYSYDTQGRLNLVSVLPNQSGGTSYTTSYTYVGNTDLLSTLQQSDGTNLTFSYTQTTSGSWYVSTIKDGNGNITKINQTSGSLANQFSTVLSNGTATQTTQSVTSTGDGQLNTKIGAPFYTVTSNDTWASIALTLYGSGNASAALQSYFATHGVTTLTTGQQLSGLPANLTYTYTQQLTQGTYIVQQGDTWQSVAQKFYGTSVAGNSLQLASGNSTLIAGQQIVIPASLLYNAVTAQGGSTVITDADGNATTYIYDASGHVDSMSQAITTINGTQATLLTSYQYDVNGRLISKTDPDGNTVNYSYDSFGNLAGTIDGAGNQTAYRYNANGQAIATTEFLFGQNDFGTAGQAAATATQRNIYNTQGLLIYAISATGEVVAYAYNLVGKLVSKIAYQGANYNVSALLPSQDITLAAIQSWQSAQNSANTELINYTYDFRGNLKSVITYAGVSATGTGLNGSATQYVYAADGQLLQTLNANNGLSQYTFNALGYVVTSTSAAGLTTTVQYNNTANSITTTLSSGLVTTQILDADGNVIKSTTSTTGGVTIGNVTNYYDADNLLRASTDQTGVTTWYFYDAAGRTIGVVDGNGDVTQTIYEMMVARHKPFAMQPLLAQAPGPLLEFRRLRITPVFPKYYRRRLPKINTNGLCTTQTSCSPIRWTALEMLLAINTILMDGKLHKSLIAILLMLRN